MCIPLSVRRFRPPPDVRPLNILLSNGRFPVSIDLARQLKRAGHNVFVVDPMHYHVCYFSSAVTASHHTPAPRVDARGYINAVLAAVKEHAIDHIIPLHEEILFLASSNEPEILSRLLAPPWEVLLHLHDKWSFSKTLEAAGLDRPKAWLLECREDLEKLPRDVDLAVKPCFGRASENVHHLKPGDPLPSESECQIGGENGGRWIAQEWLTGDRFCSYSVVRNGVIVAQGIYPVEDTLDGSSCVYFKSVRNTAIEEYIQKLVDFLPPTFTAQMAFDFIATPTRLVAIECNPRATSGIHLFAGSTLLANALFPSPSHPPEYPVYPPPRAHRQVAPGMLMWKKNEQESKLKAYGKHMKRLMGSKDVVFCKSDLLPSLMQPFLLTSYYEICRERKMAIPEMFQWDMCWEPQGGEEKLLEGGRSIEERKTVERKSLEERRDSGMESGFGDPKVVEPAEAGGRVLPDGTAGIAVKA